MNLLCKLSAVGLFVCLFVLFIGGGGDSVDGDTWFLRLLL